MLKSTILYNVTVATAYGDAEFNHEGVSVNLPEEAQKALDAVPYLVYIADEKPKAKKEEPKEEVKEEKPKAKKAPAKKATTKKKTKE